MAETGLTLGKDGYFSRAGSRFVPVGVNYWPAAAGEEMWARFPADVIQHDLDRLVSLELNAVRFFLRWSDFEPAAGEWNAGAFSRLEQMVGWCAERNLCAQPTLFSRGNHQSATPAWGRGRNFFMDPIVRDRAFAYAAEVARVIGSFHEHLLGVDVGHQMSRWPDNLRTGGTAIDSWCQSMRASIRSTYPSAMVICGNGVDSLLRDTPWRPGDSAWSYQTVHGSLVPADHAVGFDGLTDPLGQSLLPLYTEMARTFGPVMLQNIATLPTMGVRQQESYLQAVLPACWDAGGNGFLWSALFDSSGSQHAAGMGLLDGAGEVKGAFRYFVEFAQGAAEMAQPRFAANYVGLYLPKQYCAREGGAADFDRNMTSRFLATANYHLLSAGNEVHLVRGDRPIHARARRIFIASCDLEDGEVASLTAWVEAGGRLSWHGPIPGRWNAAYQQLLGAAAVDFRTAREAIVSWAGADWKISDYPQNIRLEVEPVEAEVIASDVSGFPVVMRHRVGKGMVTWALPQVDHAVSRPELSRKDRDRCTAWYRAMVAQ
jgi:hypothetical protein